MTKKRKSNTRGPVQREAASGGRAHDTPESPASAPESASGASGYEQEHVASVLATPKPIRRAYEQVADQIRAGINNGSLLPGTRLPSEGELAEQFRTSRSTVREALRLLAAWYLIKVVVGRNGGVFISTPGVAEITDVIADNVALLTVSESVTLEAVVEARQLIEVPAAGLAAERCTVESLAEVEATLVVDPSRESAEEQFIKDQQFHYAVLAATDNPMVIIAAQPLLDVIRARAEHLLRRTEFRQAMCREHQAIYAALTRHDPDASRAAMQEHLEALRPFYARVKAGRLESGATESIRREEHP